MGLSFPHSTGQSDSAAGHGADVMLTDYKVNVNVSKVLTSLYAEVPTIRHCHFACEIKNGDATWAKDGV